MIITENLGEKREEEDRERQYALPERPALPGYYRIRYMAPCIFAIRPQTATALKWNRLDLFFCLFSLSVPQEPCGAFELKCHLLLEEKIKIVSHKVEETQLGKAG
ncbi:hypothetical protein GRJ2_001215200 [Grus japonensis]|uniref:Uncharacterized protein n=1 Tax=Grus japonensis TaxID=30415 RepID=A0ABC9WPW6_GRUJA